MNIETSTKCSCGTFVVLGTCLVAAPGGGHFSNAWDALCPTCYGPVEDSSDRETIRGVGASPNDALWDWQEKHDEAWGVTIEPNPLFADLERQVAEESERQLGWSGVLRTHEGQVSSRDMEALLNCSQQFGARIAYGPESA